jgi:hypothetical protein
VKIKGLHFQASPEKLARPHHKNKQIVVLLTYNPSFLVERSRRIAVPWSKVGLGKLQVPDLKNYKKQKDWGMVQVEKCL